MCNLHRAPISLCLCPPQASYTRSRPHLRTRRACPSRVDSCQRSSSRRRRNGAIRSAGATADRKCANRPPPSGQETAKQLARFRASRDRVKRARERALYEGVRRCCSYNELELVSVGQRVRFRQEVCRARRRAGRVRAARWQLGRESAPSAARGRARRRCRRRRCRLECDSKWINGCAERLSE